MHELESQWNYNTTIGRKSLQWAEHLNAYTYLLCCVIANSPPFSLLSSLLGVHESNTQHLRKLCIKAVIFQRNIYMLEMYNLFAAWKLTDRIVVWNEMTLLQLKCVQACSFFSAGFQKPANIFLINSFGNYALFFAYKLGKKKKRNSLVGYWRSVVGARLWVIAIFWWFWWTTSVYGMVAPVKNMFWLMLGAHPKDSERWFDGVNKCVIKIKFQPRIIKVWMILEKLRL